MKTKYIYQLSAELSNDIYNEVRRALCEMGLKDGELNEAIEAAMNSRLCDLEDTIDITKYIVTE